MREGAIRCESVADFSACLIAYGFSPAEAAEHVSHESAHFETARAKGLKPYFQIQLAKGSGQGPRHFVYPSMNFDFPAAMPDETRRQVLREIIEAPADLSPRDQAQLGKSSASH